MSKPYTCQLVGSEAVHVHCPYIIDSVGSNFANISVMPING